MTSDHPNNPNASQNSAGFGASETFTIDDVRGGAISRLLSPVLLMPLVAGLLLWFMIAALFGALGVPAKGILSLLVTLVLMAGIVALWLKRTQTGLSKTWLRVDPQGMAYHSGGITREIAWADMTSIGRVVPMRGYEMSRGGSSARTGQALAAGVNRAAQQLSGSVGILGPGRLTPDGSMATTIAQQNQGVWGQDASGRDLVGIPPEDVTADWLNGKVGDWVRHHRPDLIAAHEASSN